MLPFPHLRTLLPRLQWNRGLRACVAVGAAMTASRLLGVPWAWPGLGAYFVLLVDNGGPYRSRGANFLAVLVGGSLAMILGILLGAHSLPLAMLATFAACFAFTLARTLSQPLAATGVINLIIFVICYGATDHSLAYATQNALRFAAGGLGAAVLSLALWPADPFRPARLALAEALHSLCSLGTELTRAEPHDDTAYRLTAPVRAIRQRLEAAQDALVATPARLPARTVRARNLTVLAECADLLLARLLQAAEITAGAPEIGPVLQAFAHWLGMGLAPIEHSLRQRPDSPAAEFSPDGSRATDLRRTAQRLLAEIDALATPAAMRHHLRDAVDDSLFNLGIAFDAAQAIWTGAEPFSLRKQAARQAPVPAVVHTVRETLRANLTPQSVMFRHAVRLGSVVAIDVFLMQFVHISHGYWLAMTSLILLQPFTGETVRLAGERVGGTVAGALLAALIAATVHNPWAQLAVICASITLALASYGVDYAVFCFFLTPTVVLLAMQHPGDWRLAAVRAGMTLAGAVISLAAMLLLWPERESLQMPALLALSAEAEAAYLRAVLAFWTSAHDRTASRHRHAERETLAPARRRCGLASNDAEDTLDHALLERDLPLNPRRDHTTRLHREALTFVTYTRRLTQSATAAANLTPDTEAHTLLTVLATRLDAVAATLRRANAHANASKRPGWQLESEPHDDLLRRMARQVEVLEAAANGVADSASA